MRDRNQTRKGFVFGIVSLFIIVNIPFGRMMDNTSLSPLTERESGNWWNTSWSYRRLITIDHTKIAGDLVDFPVLVKTTIDTDKAQHDGDDIVFTDSQGMKLNHEIESYNNDDGTLVAWVNVTLLHSTDDTILYLYYGNSNCSNQQNVAGTWNSKFEGVWHMGTVNDSTGKHTGTNYGADVISGQIGKAYYFAKVNSDYISFGNCDHIYAMEFFFKPATTIHAGASVQGFAHFRDSPITSMYFCEGTDGLTNEVFWLYYNPGSDPEPRTGICSDTMTLSENQYHYCAINWNSTKYDMFINGTQYPTSNYLGNDVPLIDANNLRFGKGYGVYMTVAIDEARIYNTEVDSNWLITSYNTMMSPSTFMNFGIEEHLSNPKANFTYNPINPTNTTIINFTDMSTDINGTIVSWWWDFGDQYYSSLQNPVHCYYVDGVYYVSLTVTDNHGVTNTTRKIVTVYTPPPNHPPNEPANPVPSNGETGVSITTDLMWTGGDPDVNDTVLYDVYFGTTNPPPKIVANQSATVYNLGTLDYSTKYYWKIVAWDTHAVSTTGPVWDFTTIIENRPPYPPSNPYPGNGTTNVSVEGVALNWSSGDPNGDPITYDVYFGTAFPLPKISDNQSITSFNTGPMNYGSAYYWKIVAWDNHHATTAGPVWYFITKQNSPPNAPTINGPPSGKTGRTYDYTLVAIDSENDNISYEIDWGDGTVDTWYGPVESNVIITRSHTWNEKGTFTIKARAKDAHGAIGEWGTLTVTMPFSYEKPFIQFFEQLFERFPHIFPILRHLMGY
jgi:PKD repeat protein